ncbi:hypothetical protein ACOSP7_030575 [Xanthoceras sorbifolium]
MVQGGGARRSVIARRRRRSDAAVQECGVDLMASVNRESEQQQWGGEGNRTSSGVANGPGARRGREEATWEEGDGDARGSEGAALETHIVVEGSETESGCG